MLRGRWRVGDFHWVEAWFGREKVRVGEVRPDYGEGEGRGGFGGGWTEKVEWRLGVWGYWRGSKGGGSQGGGGDWEECCGEGRANWEGKGRGRAGLVLGEESGGLWRGSESSRGDGP
ncbi:hypothetical protein Ancab_034192 [Ancistrocladus abbreviatus]